jgi:ATP-dependent helicase/nuclease subunit B
LFSEALELAHAGATLVTAGRRLARTLRESSNALQREAGREAWEAPAILPWSGWLDALWTELVFSGETGPLPVRLDEWQEEVAWEEAIERSPGTDGLLHLASTAESAAETWRLMRAWRVDAAAVQTAATDDAIAFLAWAREFEAACAREGWIDSARATDYLAARLSSIPLPERVVLAGFDEFTPQQQEFLDACRAAGVQVTLAETPCEEDATPACASFSSAGDEIVAAARWARSKLEEGETGIAVVIRNLEEVRSAVERTFSEVLDPASILSISGTRRPLFNLSAGPVLASYPLVHAALLALGLSPEGNDFDSVSRLLRSPFLGGAESEWTRRGALDAALRKGANQLSVGRIERLAKETCPQIAALLGAWRRERETLPDEQSPSDWARGFSTLLARLGWPGGTLESAAYQTVRAWRDLLSDFAKLGTVLPRLSYGDALARLGRMAEARSFQPETGPAPIQILGLLETFGMRFEHLWIAGLDDEHWPRPPQPAAFLPPALQRARGLPRTSPERELAFAQRITSRLLASAPDVVVSHALREGDSELGPSPLIAGLARGQVELPGYPLYRDAMGRPVPERIQDSTAPPHQDEIAPGGTRVFQFQAQCPFRAFAELRLNARPLDAPAPGLDAMERGTLVHRALEIVWNRLGSHARLCDATEDGIEEIVTAAVADALASVEADREEALPPKFAALERERLKKLLHDWLAVEKRRAPFTVLESEEKLPAEAGGIRCDVRVDRVDRLEDGRDVIIDYKTGQPSPSSWSGDRPDEPQLPLYAVNRQGQVAAVLFAQVRAGDAGFKGYAAEEGLVPGAKVRELDADLAEWRRVLDRLGAGFRAGVSNVDPKRAATCRYCALLPLCRFSESETPAAAFEAEDGDA